ncbi:Ig-like domain-containing protein [Roseibacillus ishigakijimensis]|uniref:Fibronectin type-III domain-containing protein n=1 Tax=Roseibacillus ishigakijimensis TaxID=454146 RepID=A0A934VKQ6_9BACT|nr:Ig-like domain-containing protein [Roseibacillus ishigakijimensis]MBK1832427.1 hypothetical protein [Roseibacillus ishigakijimensis]
MTVIQQFTLTLGAALAMAGGVGAEASLPCGCSSHPPLVSGPDAVKARVSLDLPDGLPESFTLPLALGGEIYHLHLQKNRVFGANTRFLVSDGAGALTPVDPGPDRSYLGQVGENADYAVSAVLTEEGLIANIIRPGEVTITVSPTGEEGIHELSLDHDQQQACGTEETLPGPIITAEGEELGATPLPITTAFTVFAAKSSGAEEASTATLAPERVMDVLEYEVGVEISSRAFLNNYGGDLSYAQSVAQGIPGNLDSRYLRATGIKHRLGTVIIRTSAANDPLDGQVNNGTHSGGLSAFRDYWNNHPAEVGTTHDLAVYHVRASPSGLAYVNSVGTGSRYALSASNGATSWADGTLVHEFGHSWSLRHTGDAPITQYDEDQYNAGHIPPGSFYESKPRSGSGASSAGGKHLFVSIMHGGGDHNIGRMASDEAQAVYNVKQQKRNHGDLIANPGPIPPFGFRDRAVSFGDPVTIDAVKNDYDCNNDVLDLRLLDTVSQKGGALSLSQGTGPGGRNEVIYTPPPGYNGPDFFSYTVCDATGLTDWGTVYVINQGPVTVNTNTTSFNYDLGPLDSPVLAGWAAIGPETTGDINWTGAAVEARDRGLGDGVNDANRDFVTGSGSATLNHKIGNGVWKITINMGDRTHAHDQMGVRAEGITIGSGVNSAAAEFSYVNGQVEVRDGELNLEIFDQGGSDANWVINRLSLEKVAEIVDGTRYSYNHDLGPAGSVIRPGWTLISPESAGAVYWSGAPVTGLDRGQEGTNEINRDLITGSGAATLHHKLTPGVWGITMNMGDRTVAHDQMGVRAEGELIGSGVNSAAGSFPYVNADVTVTDGELNLEFFDGGGADLNWVVTRLSLIKKSEIVDLSKTRYDYDIGPKDSVVQSGWTPIWPDTTGEISWSGDAIESADRDLGGGVNNINRDFVFGSGTTVLNHKLANGNWAITLNMGDRLNPHDDMVVRAEGVLLEPGLDSEAGAYPYVRGEVAVSDGELNLEFSDGGGSDPNWVVTRMSLEWKGSLGPQAPAVASGSLSGLTQTSVNLSVNVVDDGGETPAVTLYYGQSDGTTVAGDWSTSVFLGSRGEGSTIVPLSGLAPGKTYYYNVAASNSAGTGWGSTASFTTLPGGYSHWSSEHEVTTGPQGDDDGDGVSNLVEYALGLDPQAAEPSPGTLRDGVLSFAKGAEAAANGDLRYTIETSPDLQDPWTTVEASIETDEEISCSLPEGQSRIFARLRVVQQ